MAQLATGVTLHVFGTLEDIAFCRQTIFDFALAANLHFNALMTPSRQDRPEIAETKVRFDSFHGSPLHSSECLFPAPSCNMLERLGWSERSV